MTPRKKLGIYTPIYDKSWGILENYAIPQQNKTGNLHLLILEEWGEVSHASWGIEISQLTSQLLPNSMHK